MDVCLRLMAVGGNFLEAVKNLGVDGKIVALADLFPEQVSRARQHFDVPEDTALLVEKIDPKTGAVLWKVEREGLVRYASGQFLYTVASQRGDAEDEDFAMPLLNTGFQKIAHVRVKRLDPANGRVLWEHYHGHTPLDVAFEKNTIHFLCKKEMRVLKFFSF